jgi:hypothetical protein
VGLQKAALRKRLFCAINLTPTANKYFMAEGISHQQYALLFGQWPKCAKPGKRASNSGHKSSKKRKAGGRSQERANDTQSWKKGERNGSGWQTGDQWHNEQRRAARAELRKTAVPLPELVPGPCGKQLAEGESRRLTLWGNGYDLECWASFGDFTIPSKLGFQAAAIFRCGTFVVLTDITVTSITHDTLPGIKLQFGYAKCKFQRACKGNDPEYPCRDEGGADRAGISELIARYPYRARQSSYGVHDKFFSSEGDDDEDSENQPRPRQPQLQAVHTPSPSTPQSQVDSEQEPDPQVSATLSGNRVRGGGGGGDGQVAWTLEQWENRAKALKQQLSRMKQRGEGGGGGGGSGEGGGGGKGEGGEAEGECAEVRYEQTEQKTYIQLQAV